MQTKTVQFNIQYINDSGPTQATVLPSIRMLLPVQTGLCMNTHRQEGVYSLAY